jgi:polysaccharide biosynthesis transport protein
MTGRPEIVPSRANDDDVPASAPRAIDMPPPAAAGELTPLQVALRHKWMIAIFAAVLAAAMYGGLQFVAPTYVAEAEVRIDMPRLRVIGESNSLLSDEQPTVELVRTEMAALNSPRLALAAVMAMGLAQLPAFQLCPPVSRLQAMLDLAGRLRGQPVPRPACETEPEYAAKLLLGAMTFGADRDSFIIQISASMPDPELAARIANGYADAYITWQGSLKARLAQQADEWLSADLANMQARMLADDAAVEAYRQKHHLIGLHSRGDADGSAIDTISTQRLEQQNTDLSAIDAALADKSAMLAQVQQALRDGHLDAIAPVLGSPLIQQLLARQSELSANLAELHANYGATYPAVAAAAAALARNEGQLHAEIDKIVHGLGSDVAALAARKATVAAQVEGVQQQVAGESQAAVDLSELQRAAETDRRIYESLFVRLKQVDAERRMEQASAAVVVEALPPDMPTYPRTHMMVAGTFLAGLGLGVGLAFAAEMTSRRFRDTEQVEGEIGLPVIGIFAKSRRAPQDVVIDQPMSVAAEAMHGVLTHLAGRPESAGAMGQGTPRGRVVMVTSALPGEGKSCLTVALGRSAMREGLSAFVLDCDLRRPMVARLVSGGRRGGTAAPLPGHDLRDPADLIAEVMRHVGVDERSALRHLSLSDYVTNPHGLMAWPGLAGMLAYLRGRYDLVLLDTPPVLAVSDALKLGGLADEVVVAIDWSETPRQAVVAAVRVLHRAQIAITGLVMTKVDLRRYARSNAGEGFYLRHYRGYQRAVDGAA